MYGREHHFGEHGLQEPAFYTELGFREARGNVGVLVCAEGGRLESAEGDPVRGSDFGGLEALGWVRGGGEEVNVWAEDHESGMFVLVQPWRNSAWVAIDLRYLSPRGGYDTLRKIAHGNGIVVVQVYTDFLQSFPYGSDLVVLIFWIPLSTWENDMPVPFISYPRCPFDEEQFWVSMLHPVLLKESL